MTDLTVEALERYAATVARMSDHRVWREWQNLKTAAGDPRLPAEARRIAHFALVAAAEMVQRGITSEPPLGDPGLHFRPAEVIEGRSPIQLWDGDRHAATLYVQPAGLHLVFEAEYSPGRLSLEVSRPMALEIPITVEESK